MKKLLRIGTRDSPLAQWQANHVKKILDELGCHTELVLIKSEGDINTITPLYELGVQGIFTKALDVALLNNKIDIAVHSMKDVPTQQAIGLKQAAVLERASHKDILVYKEGINICDENKNRSYKTIGTSSIRRRAQWLNRYPNDKLENLRGNINTRLKKLQENNWDGIILAAAGLDRINSRPNNSIELDWMLPAPAQGAITLSCRENDRYSCELSYLLNHKNTEICTQVERDFLRALMGGCSMPISALATIKDTRIVFKGNLLSIDGKEKYELHKEVEIEQWKDLGFRLAQELLANPKANTLLYAMKYDEK